MSVIERIKRTIIDELEGSGYSVERIILFGSRARGEYDDESDWDLLIIMKDKYSIDEKMLIMKIVNRVLARILIPSDIIIKSSKEIDFYKEQIGSVVREALKEGIEI